jgi:uncharacterized protein
MSVSSFSFPNDPVSYLTLSWNELADLTAVLARQMAADQVRCDRIVTLAKGGWAMTRSLSDFLQVAEVSSVGLRTYSGIQERLPEPEVYQDLSAKIEGETIVLFDDVADTGESLKYVKEFLLKRGAKKIISAAVFYKPHSKLKPEYYAKETSDWIIFPYEVVEMVILLRKRWTEQGATAAEIESRLRQFPFHQTASDFVAPL